MDFIPVIDGKMVIRCGPHRGTHDEFLSVRREFMSLEMALDYLIHSYDEGCLTFDDLCLRLFDTYREDEDFVICFNVLTVRFGDDDFVEKYGSPQCIGHIDFLFPH